MRTRLAIGGLFMLYSLLGLPSACTFSSQEYNAYAGIETNLSLEIPQSAPFTINFSCGNGLFIIESYEAPLPASPMLLNFSCVYQNIGIYHANAELSTPSDAPNQAATCQGPSTIYVSAMPANNISVREISLPPTIEKGKVVEVSARLLNIGETGTQINGMELLDVTEGKVISTIGEAFEIGPGGSKTITFKWNTEGASTGLHLINVTATVGGSQTFNITHTTIIAALPKFIEVINVTNSDGSVNISVKTDLEANLTITYWLKTNLQKTSLENSTYAKRHTFQILLAENGEYVYILSACNHAGCQTSDAYSFVIASAQASPTPSMQASASATPTSQPSPTTPASTPPAAPSITPSPIIVVGEPEATQTPTPSTIAALPIGTIEPDIEIDGEELSRTLENDTVSLITQSPDKGRFNLINITSMIFEPVPIIRTRTLRMMGYTDSKSSLSQVKCYIPPEDRDKPESRNAAKCVCDPNFSNTKRFLCEIKPAAFNLVGARYTIELRNENNESGIFVIVLRPGERGEFRRYVVSSKRNELYTYIAIFISLMLVGYGLYHVFTRLEKEHKKGEVLLQQKKAVLEDMETLKFHYLKRNIDYETYNRAMTQKQKELTEVNTRIGERESRIYGKAPKAEEAAVHEEVPQNRQEKPHA